MDHIIIAGIVTFFVAILSIIFFLFTSRKVKDGILLIGLNDSGKTSLFYKLTDDIDVKSVSSIDENVSSLRISNKNSKIIDVPGHEKIRNTIILKYRDIAKAILFVLDSQTILTNIRDISEYLYEILIDPKISKAKIPILILCNKQDLEMSKSANVIKTRLENEMSIVKLTKAGALESIDTKSQIPKYLGNKEESFRFDQLPNRVEFKECSVKNNVNEIRKWLNYV